MKTILKLSLFVVFALPCVTAFSQTSPKLLPFQGRLTDQTGMAVSNGVRLVQFKIYEVPTGGSPVWAGELHRTTVNGGLVNVMLGTKTPFSGVDFDGQLYLEITVDVSGPGGTPDNAITAADPPMLPRQAILPVVFAKEAADSRKLNGSDWTPVFGVNTPNGPIPASKLADGSLPGSKLQSASITANQIAPQTITALQIADGAVINSKLGDTSVTSSKIAGQSIAVQHLQTSVAQSLVPVGSIMPFAGATPPPGWLLCDGTAISRTTYSDLFSAINTAWGSGNGTTFNLPDLRGYFLRGTDTVGGRDPDRTSRTNAAGQVVGAVVGGLQSDAFQSHNHKVYGTLSPGTVVGGSTRFSLNGADYAVNSNPFTRDSGALSDEYAADELSPARTSTESRPKNAYVNYIIKY